MYHRVFAAGFLAFSVITGANAGCHPGKPTCYVDYGGPNGSVSLEQQFYQLFKIKSNTTTTAGPFYLARNLPSNVFATHATSYRA